MAILKTIGIFVVTALAATAEAVPGVTITVTRRWTRSVTSDDNRSYWPFRSAVFDRYILALDLARRSRHRECAGVALR